MRKDIHPKYYPKAKVICACGNTFTVGSTQELIEVEILLDIDVEIDDEILLLIDEEIEDDTDDDTELNEGEIWISDMQKFCEQKTRQKLKPACIVMRSISGRHLGGPA